MEIILTALKDSFSLILKLFVIILPLTISYEFLKHKQSQIEKMRFSVFGITHNGLVPLITGIIIGLTYGAGIIIYSIRTSNINKREAFLILLFLSICHAMIEDTLIFVIIGANGFILVAFRFILAIILTYLMYRSKLLQGLASPPPPAKPRPALRVPRPPHSRS
ncbi:MAG: nucleoside recognition protein [Deltaproteobacteria bacterium]